MYKINVLALQTFVILLLLGVFLTTLEVNSNVPDWDKLKCHFASRTQCKLAFLRRFFTLRRLHTPCGNSLNRFLTFAMVVIRLNLRLSCRNLAWRIFHAQTPGGLSLRDREPQWLLWTKYLPRIRLTIRRDPPREPCPTQVIICWASNIVISHLYTKALYAKAIICKKYNDIYKRRTA